MGKDNNPRRVADNEAMAVNRMMRVSPQKLNLVAQQIRGLPVERVSAFRASGETPGVERAAWRDLVGRSRSFARLRCAPQAKLALSGTRPPGRAMAALQQSRPAIR